MQDRTGHIPRGGDRASLDGCFVGLRFSNDDGFVIATFEEEGTFRQFPAKGTVIPFRLGQPLRLHGAWEQNARFGTQFRIDTYEPRKPTSERAIEAYLGGSGVVPGLGEKTARAIVSRFGEDTLRVMEEEPGRLREVAGVGPKLVEAVREHFGRGDAEQEAMAYLMGLGISAKRAAKARRHFGEETVAKVQTNPYCLLEVPGITFPLADSIARALDWPPDHPRRVQEGIVHYLWKGCQDGGHAFLEREDLEARVAEAMDLGTAAVGEGIARLAESGRVVVEDVAVYPRFLHDVECDIARAVLADTGVKREREGFDRELAELETHLGIELHVHQREAVWQAVTAPLSVLTGGPGTGKTTTLRAILSMCERYGERVACGSPTGRAAKRMAEVTGRPAYTIHRLLGLRPAEEGDDETGLVATPLGAFETATVVVLDEFSMADMALAAHVIRNLGRRRLVLVGDVDQLPSVGPGRILRDIIDSGVANVTVLTEIFRQAHDSGIVMNARRINAGESPRFEGYDDFHLVEATASEAARKLVGGTFRALEKRGFDPLRDVQVLSPMKKGEAGIEALNVAIQQRLNPRRNEHEPEHVARSGATFRRGDKVMQIRNDYDRDVFNGDQGYVLSVEPYAKNITVDFGDGTVPRPVEYDFGELTENLIHAFAITTHKCVDPRSRVSTGAGLLPIGDVWSGARSDGRSTLRPVAGLEVQGISGTGKVREVFRSPHKETCVTVTTRHGFKITASTRHPLASPRGERGLSWIPCGDLRPGDYVSLVRGTIHPEEYVRWETADLGDVGRKPVVFPPVLDEGIALWLGHLVGDGSYNDRQDYDVRVCGIDPEVLGHFEDTCCRLGLTARSYHPKGKAVKIRYVLSKRLRTGLLRLGLDYAACRDKRVPETVFRSPGNVKSAFLRGLMDTDGSVTKDGHVVLTSAAEPLVDDVLLLLLSLGIVGKKRRTTNGSFRIEISGLDRQAYGESIGFTVAHKTERLAAAAGREGRKNGLNEADMVPGGTEIVMTIVSSIRGAMKTRRTFGPDAPYALRHLPGSIHARKPRRTRARDLSEALDYLESHFRTETLPVALMAAARSLANESLYYDEVMSVEPAESRTVYDLEVPETVSFAANGFLSHNSQGGEWPAVVVVLTTAHYAMLERNLLYTAITRARDLCAVVGQRQALAQAAANDRPVLRNTRLAERIRRQAEERVS